MDGTDLEILRLLTENPQEPFYRIAKKIGVSPRTVEKRFQKMKEAGTIIHPTIIVDLSKIGYQGEAYLQIVNAPGFEKTTTIDALKRIPNIFLVTEIIGNFDILAIAAVKDYRSIINMINTVRQLPSVEKVEADFVTDTQFPATTGFNRQLATEEL
jgi:DNA-binding Lrp family transcriptional regulator